MSNAADDSLDWTFGWTGRLQFVAVTQRGDDADNGIEADNNEFNNNVLPRSNPQIYNVTLCGDPTGTREARARKAQTSGAERLHIRNFLLTGFKATGFQISEERRSPRSITAPRRWVPAWPGTWALPERSRGADALERAGHQQQRTVPEHPDERRSRRFDGGLLEPRGARLSTLFDSLLGRRSARTILPPNDGFFEVTTYIGAVAPAPAPNWMAGWTSFPQN